MTTNKLESLAQRMQRLQDQLREAQQEHNRRESKRAFRAMRRAGLTAADVEKLLARMSLVPIAGEVSDEHPDHRSAE